MYDQKKTSLGLGMDLVFQPAKLKRKNGIKFQFN